MKILKVCPDLTLKAVARDLPSAPGRARAPISVLCPTDWNAVPDAAVKFDETEKKAVLLIDRDPVNRRMLALRLLDSGFRVMDVEDSGEALEKIRRSKPDVVIISTSVPQIIVFQFCRALRLDSECASTPIILTAAQPITDRDEEMARALDALAIVPQEAGHQEILDTVARALGQTATDKESEELEGLRMEFLLDGSTISNRMLRSLQADWDPDAAHLIFHRWAGTAGCLGFSRISRLAYEAEQLQNKPIPEVKHRIQEILEGLSEAFSQSGLAPRSSVPALVQEFLAGKRFALVGFNDKESAQLCQLLEGINAFPRLIQPAQGDTGFEVPDIFDLLLFNTQPGSPEAERIPQRFTKPILIFVRPDTVASAALEAQRGNRDFLLTPWKPEEILLRSYQLLSESARDHRDASETKGPSTNNRILIADDDPTITSLVAITLKSYQMECTSVGSGGTVLELSTRLMPGVIVLDVNMPELDGFQVLSALKADSRTSAIPVVLLTARKQEKDIIRGFALGADDYVVKPFNPLELVVRLKRFLRK